MRTQLAAVAAVAALATLTACGSTVQVGSAQVAGGDVSSLDGGLAITPQPGITSNTTGIGQQDGPDTGIKVPVDDVTFAPTDAATPVQGGGPTVSAGVTKTISVGIPYTPAASANAFSSSVGGNNLAVFDPKLGFEALIKRINDAGGAGGIKLVPTYHAFTASGNFANNAQAACADFTQDHHVQVVIGSPQPSDTTLFDCLAKARIPYFHVGLGDLTDSYLQKEPLLLEVAGLTLDHLAEVQIASLQSQGFFESTLPAKVGVLNYDNPQFTVGGNALVAALKKRAISVGAHQEVATPHSADDLGQLATNVTGAVVRFKALGITHVVFSEQDAFMSVIFGVIANQQNYFPRYGYSSNEAIDNISTNVPDRALKGALFAGYDPANDGADLTTYNPAGRTCITDFTKLGYDVRNANSRLGAVQICDSVNFLVAALTAAGSTNATALVAAAHKVSSSFQSALTFRVDLTHRSDGVAAVRPGAFVDSCKCFRYTGPVASIG